MEYEIICTASVVTGNLVYKVVLWHGKKSYKGNQEYKTWLGAARAAHATGATPKD